MSAEGPAAAGGLPRPTPTIVSTRRGHRHRPRFIRETRRIFRTPGKFFRALLGVLLLAAAVVGLLIPVVPQLPFFFAALFLLGSVSPGARHLRIRLRARIRRRRERRAARRRERGGRE